MIFRPTIKEQFDDILEFQLTVTKDECKPGANIMKDLGADIIDLEEIRLAIEDDFKIELPHSVMTTLHTVHEIIQYIEEAN